MTNNNNSKNNEVGVPSNGMNKFLTIFAIIALVITGYSLTIEFAHAEITILGQKLDCDPAKSPTQGGCGIPQFIKLAAGVIKWAIQFLAIPLAVVFIIYGGFVIMTAGGNPSRMEEGKKIIKAAVIGLIIALLSALIVTTVFNLLPTETKYIPKLE